MVRIGPVRILLISICNDIIRMGETSPDLGVFRARSEVLEPFDEAAEAAADQRLGAVTRPRPERP
jgi:hypothetical protein